VESAGSLADAWTFDHIAGAAEIANAFDPPLPIGLHPADLGWYRREGGARKFGMSIAQPPEPTIAFEDGLQLALREGGEPVAEVRYAPGHSAGHVMFYCETLGVLFCGDVIFRQGIGRADLEGGDMDKLLRSIREKVLTLPDETRLLPGHGLESTVGYERGNNPFYKIHHQAQRNTKKDLSVSLVVNEKGCLERTAFVV